MKKLSVLLIVAFSLTQCGTIKNEIAEYKLNKMVIEKSFPDSYVRPVNGYNDVFIVSSPNFVYKAKMKNNVIAELDTLKNFAEPKPVTTSVVTRK